MWNINTWAAVQKTAHGGPDQQNYFSNVSLTRSVWRPALFPRYVWLLNTFSIGPSGDLERKFKSENIGTEVQKKLRSQRCGLLSEKEVGKHRLSIEWTLLIVVHLYACQRNKYFRRGHSHSIHCFFRFFSAQICVNFLKRTNLQKNSAHMMCLLFDWTLLICCSYLRVPTQQIFK